MTNRILEIAAAVLLTLAAILSSVSAARASDIVVNGAFARASASPLIKTGAVYLAITNPGAEADRLVAVATPAAGAASIHETRTVDGVMTMDMKEALDIPAGATVALAPGGMHIMLMNLTAPLTEGQQFDVTLTFVKAGSVTVSVPVAGVAANQAPGSSGG
jgi:copper(I)-binding protein